MLYDWDSKKTNVCKEFRDVIQNSEKLHPSIWQQFDQRNFFENFYSYDEYPGLISDCSPDLNGFDEFVCDNIKCNQCFLESCLDCVDRQYARNTPAQNCIISLEEIQKDLDIIKEILKNIAKKNLCDVIGRITKIEIAIENLSNEIHNVVKTSPKNGIYGAAKPIYEIPNILAPIPLDIRNRAKTVNEHYASARPISVKKRTKNRLSANEGETVKSNFIRFTAQKDIGMSRKTEEENRMSKAAAAYKAKDLKKEGESTRKSMTQKDIEEMSRKIEEEDRMSKAAIDKAKYLRKEVKNLDAELKKLDTQIDKRVMQMAKIKNSK